MTPTLLAEYLETMRRAGCMSAEVICPEGTVRAVFAPDEPAPAFGKPIDSEPEPGGWKAGEP